MFIYIYIYIYTIHKHLIKCQNDDNNFPIKRETIVRNVGNIRIKEALSQAKFDPQINSRLELKTEYIVNMHILNTYLSLKNKSKK